MTEYLELSLQLRKNHFERANSVRTEAGANRQSQYTAVDKMNGFLDDGPVERLPQETNWDFLKRKKQEAVVRVSRGRQLKRPEFLPKVKVDDGVHRGEDLEYSYVHSLAELNIAAEDVAAEMARHEGSQTGHPNAQSVGLPLSPAIPSRARSNRLQELDNLLDLMDEVAGRRARELDDFLASFGAL